MKKRRPRPRRGTSLNNGSNASSGGDTSTGSDKNSSAGASSTALNMGAQAKDSSLSVAAATRTTAQATTKRVGSSSTSNSNKPDNNSSLKPKRKNKRRLKRRPRKRRGIGLNTHTEDVATATPSNTTDSAGSDNLQADNTTISPNGLGGVASASSALAEAITATSGKQAKRWELQDEIAEAKRQKIQKLKEQNPALYKKIQQTITEQENKIKAFATNLKTKEEKAAFVNYSKNFLLNTWTQKLRNRNVKTGLRESKFNYDRILFQKLGPEEQKRMTSLIDETKQKSKAFQAQLSTSDQADFEDMDSNPRMDRLNMLVEAGKSKRQKRLELQQQTREDILEQRKNLFHLKRKKNKGLMTAHDIRMIQTLEEKLSNLKQQLK